MGTDAPAGAVAPAAAQQDFLTFRQQIRPTPPKGRTHLHRRSGDAPMGVIADFVNEVVDVREEDVEAPPDLGSEVRVDYLTGLARSGRGFVLLLELEVDAALTRVHARGGRVEGAFEARERLERVAAIFDEEAGIPAVEDRLDVVERGLRLHLDEQADLLVSAARVVRDAPEARGARGARDAAHAGRGIARE